jgi:hypothetical protein
VPGITFTEKARAHLPVASAADSLAALRAIDDAGIRLAEFAFAPPHAGRCLSRAPEARCDLPMTANALRTGIIDVIALWRRDMIRTARQPELATFSITMGIFLLLLFRYVFGDVIGAGAGIDYLSFLVPGTLVVTALTGAVQTGTALAGDLTGGVNDRFRALPIARIAVIAGKTLADAVRKSPGRPRRRDRRVPAGVPVRRHPRRDRGHRGDSRDRLRVLVDQRGNCRNGPRSRSRQHAVDVLAVSAHVRLQRLRADRQDAPMASRLR